MGRRTVRRFPGALAALVLGLGLNACHGSDPTVPAAPRTFEFLIRGLSDADGRFAAVTSDPAVLARIESELALPADRRRFHIHGPVALGDGGHNAPWRWHFVPGAWEMVEASVELCDGTPAMVDADPSGWIDKVGAFCPWGSFVERER